MDTTNELIVNGLGTLLTILVASTVSVLLAIMDIARMYVRIAEAGPSNTKVIKIAKDTKTRMLIGILTYTAVVIFLLIKDGHPLW